MVSFLAPKFNSIQNLCQLNCTIPKEVDQSWYKKSILKNLIETVSELKIIKTSSKEGTVSVIDALFPEVDTRRDDYKQNLEHLMKILIPLYDSTGCLI